MKAKEQLLQEIEQSSEVLLEEVLDFLLFAKTRRGFNDVTQSSSKPIWEVAHELVQDLPPDVLDAMPIDGAAQHDHYLYGTPKQQP